MLKQLLSTGITQDQTQGKKFKIKMINGIAIGTIAILISYTIFYLLAEQGFLLLSSHIPYFITAILIVYFHQQHKYVTAEYVLYLFYPISILGSCIMLGKEYHAEYLFFLTGMGTVFFFQQKRPKRFFLMYSVAFFITAKIYYQYYPNGLIEFKYSLTPYFSFFNGAIAFGMVFSIVNGAFRYNSKLNKKLKILTETQDEILKQRTLEIQEKSERLEQVLHEQKRFSYISAHDLREPLRNIMSFSQLLERDIKANQLDQIQDYLQYINSGVSRIDRMTNDIVTYTELEEHISKTSEVDTQFIVQQIFNDFHSVSSNLKLNHQSLPVISINNQLCYSLFFNLIQNAIQYGNKTPVRVDVRCKKQDKFYLFSVKDNGKGIDPQFHDTIFEMFKRLHNDLNKSGSGIGLPICKKIITAYGGEVWVESKVNAGSIFYFKFPV